MTHFNLRWQKRGGHVHVRVFSAPTEHATHGKNGDLVFREQEWTDLIDGITGDAMDSFGCSSFTVLPDDGT